MSDLFDFLGCMSLINGRSSNSPQTRASHPKRPAPRLRLNGDSSSALPPTTFTPHPPSQPYYSRYPITRAPTVREAAVCNLPSAQAMLPNYPYAVRHVTRYNPPSNQRSPQTYWKTYGTPTQPAYIHNNGYAPRAMTESYMGPPLSYVPQGAPMPYGVPPSDFDFYARSQVEVDSYVEEEDPMWAYRSYPSQFPSAQARVHRERAEQLPYYNPYSHDRSVPPRDAGLPVSVSLTGTATSPDVNKGVLQSPCQNSATMSCTMDTSAAASPLGHVQSLTQTFGAGIDSTHSAAAFQDENYKPDKGSNAAEYIGGDKQIDHEGRPLTTMAETSDDAGTNDTWGGMQLCASDIACQHSPEVVGNSDQTNHIPSQCVCQQCREVPHAGAHVLSYAPAAPPSEKVAKSPLEMREASHQRLPAFHSVTETKPSEASKVDSESQERSAKDSLISVSNTPGENLVEAGVGTETVESGPSASWSCCSSMEPVSSEVDLLAQQKQRVIEELQGRHRPVLEKLRQVGDSHKKGEESLVRKRVEEWNDRFSVMAANKSPIRLRPQQKRLSLSRSPVEKSPNDETDDLKQDKSLQASAATEREVDLKIHAMSQSTQSPPTEACVASESMGNADDFLRLMRSPDWSQYLESLPTSQKHSPSPTQLPRNPFMATTERSTYMLRNLSLSPEVVPRRLDQTLSKNQSALKLANESDVARRIQLVRQLTAVGARDDLDKQLQDFLRQNGVPYEFVRLKRGYYAVCRPQEECSEVTDGSDGYVKGSPKVCTFDSSVYFGRAQQAVAHLPPIVLCYVVVSLDFGRLSVAVLSRSNVLKHFGCEGIRKWLTPQNRFFTQKARRRTIGSDERRRSTGGCTQLSTRRHREELPVGGEFPWRRGQAEPITSFIDFLRRVASEIPKDGNSDPFPTRVPFQTTTFDSFRCHNRRASG